MSFERWNALVDEVTRKRTPPQPTTKGKNESEVEQVEQIPKKQVETP